MPYCVLLEPIVSFPVSRAYPTQLPFQLNNNLPFYYQVCILVNAATHAVYFYLYSIFQYFYLYFFYPLPFGSGTTKIRTSLVVRNGQTRSAPLS